MKINADILKETSQYVSGYLPTKLAAHFTYHNIGHTRAVVDQTEMLCDALEINNHNKKVLGVAAWFHDIGYTIQVDDHEKFGVHLAEEFLLKHSVDDKDIETVKAAILATRYPQQPTSKLEKILCDADLLHVASADFLEKSELLRKEWSATKGRTYSDNEWYQVNYEFLAGHSFHTKYCRNSFDKQKKKNIKKLESLMSMKVSENEPTGKIKRIKPQELVKGVETLFRNSSRNHMELSAMADNKAHILLSVSSVIASIVLSFMLQQLTQSPYLIIPTGLLLAVCLTTIVLAVLTTKPKITKGLFTVDQIKKRDVNLLFFGNFYKMDLNTYEWGINELIHDKDYLYTSMTKDIYYLGKVLAVKYKYLNIGYYIFMYGIIASVMAFIISFILTNSVI